MITIIINNNNNNNNNDNNKWERITQLLLIGELLDLVIAKNVLTWGQLPKFHLCTIHLIAPCNGPVSL